MSDPIRYTGKTEGSLLGSPHWEHPEGEWVKWQDYALLKAEVERLDALCKQLMAQHSDISCENVRLRKAGDEVIHEWSSGHGTDVENFTKALWVWAVAKEGKQS